MHRCDALLLSAVQKNISEGIKNNTTDPVRIMSVKVSTRYGNAATEIGTYYKDNLLKWTTDDSLKNTVSNLCIFIWCRDVIVKHADSQHRDCQFDSSMYHCKNAIGEEGNLKLPHEIYFPRKNSRALSLVSATLEIEYATTLLARKAMGTHRVKSASLE